MATLDETENFLVDVEHTINVLKEKCTNKQNDRVLSSHVWMSDYIEGIIKDQVNPLKEALTSVKNSYVGDFKSATQFDAVIAFCNDINKLLNDINTQYKMRSNLVDLKLKFQYNMPQIEDKVKHMRNRFNIIRGQLSKKGYEHQEDNWWG